MESGKEAEDFLRRELKDLLKDEWVLEGNRFDFLETSKD